MGNLANSVTDKFQFNISNNTTAAVNVAIATGNVPVMGLDTTSTPHALHYHDNTILVSEGYGANIIVLDDATVSNVAMSSASTDTTIRHTKADLLHNPRCIKKITIISGTETQFGSSMRFGETNPYHHENARNVNLQQYFSVNQFQSNKIEINYAMGELQWNDSFFWSLDVVGKAQASDAAVAVQVIVEFYPDQN